MRKTMILLLLLAGCFLFAACSQATVVKNLPNKIVSTDEQKNLDSCIAELEERVSVEYQLENFRLICLRVDIMKNDKRDCRLLVKGIHKENGATVTWGKVFEISYEDYQLLSGVNKSHLVYNVELDETNDQIISKVPSWVIVGVQRIMFE